MTFTSSDAITQEAVLAQLEQITEENLVWRNAFRPLDATGINSDTMTVPVPNDDMEEVVVIAEGADYPRDKDTARKVNIPHEKFGKEIEITDEAIADNRLDTVRIQAEKQLRRMAEGMDQFAYAELAANLNASADAPVGDGGGNLTYDDVVDAMVLMTDSPYNFSPTHVFVGPQGMGDLLKSDDFNRASELGDQVVTRGYIGTIAGMETWVSNTGDLGAGEAIMVDPLYYGYESTREGLRTEEYDDRRHDARVIKARARMGWKAIQPNAAVKIEG